MVIPLGFEPKTHSLEKYLKRETQISVTFCFIQSTNLQKYLSH